MPGLHRSLSLRYTSAKSGFQLRRADTAGMSRTRPSRPRPSAPDEGPALPSPRLARNGGQVLGPPVGRPCREGPASRPADRLRWWSLPGMEVRISSLRARAKRRPRSGHFAVDAVRRWPRTSDLGLVRCFKTGSRSCRRRLSVDPCAGASARPSAVPGALRFRRRRGPARIQAAANWASFELYGVGQVASGRATSGVALDSASLEVPVVGAGLVDDALDRKFRSNGSAPGAGLDGQLCGRLRRDGQPLRVQVRFRDVDDLRYAVSSFLSPAGLSLRALMPLPSIHSGHRERRWPTSLHIRI